MNNQYSNWQPVFFDFLVAGLVILLFFRLLQFVLPVLLFRKRKNRSIMRSLPVVETGTWLLFFSWYLFRFAAIMSIYAFVVTGILLTLIFWISRFFIKDLMAGIFFRVSARFREGEVIIYKGHKGTIKHFGTQSLEIESPGGQILYIPYSRLMETLNIKHESTDQSAAYNFSLKISPLPHPEESIKKIRTFLISLPWSSTHKKPAVLIQEKAEGYYKADVTAYPVEKAFARRIEQLTREEFELPD